MAKKIRRSYTGFEVVKVDAAGTTIETYQSITQAMEGEHLRHSTLMKIIEGKQIFKGCTFSYGRKFKYNASSNPKRSRNKFPWEKNGHFDIDGWGKVTI
jgi:hypothetical protein